MNLKLDKIVQSYILKYLEYKFPDLKFSDQKNFQCPFHTEHTSTENNTANIFPKNSHSLYCFDPRHGKLGNIYDMVRRVEPDMINLKDSDIAEYLISLLNIDTEIYTDKLLDLYEQAGFALIPLAAGTKEPPYGFKWREKIYKDKKIWQDWLDRGYGLALVLGKESNVVLVEFDDDETYEKFKDIMGDTLRQKTKRGAGHFYYNYDPMFVKTLNKVLKNTGDKIELRTEGAYSVIAPTSVDGETRVWNEKKIIDMPDQLKMFFKPFYDNVILEQTVDEKIQEAITNESVGTVDLTGKRNDFFIATAGIFRKWMNEETVFKTLSFISNNVIDKPIPHRELKAIMGQVKKYQCYDKEELAKFLLQRLDVIKEATAFQMAKSLGYEQKDIEDVLHYLETQQKIISIGKNRYKRLKQVEWKDDFNEESGIPVDFVVPYFHDYAFFNMQDIVVIGGVTGTGKTYFAGNIIKQLVDQKIKPYLISTESGSRIGKVAQQLKMKPGDFYMTSVKSANDIELPDDGICIIDWLQITDGDFSKISVIYEHLHEQVKKHNCFVFVFAQLKKDGKWFAENIHDWYSAFTCRYLYGNDGKDNINTYIQTDKIRDAKGGYQYVTIPTKFDKTTSIIHCRDMK